MRFKVKSSNIEGCRIIKKFAIFPIRIKDEIRWLETIKIRQCYSYNYADGGYMNIEFID